MLLPLLCGATAQGAGKWRGSNREGREGREGESQEWWGSPACLPPSLSLSYSSPTASCVVGGDRHPSLLPPRSWSPLHDFAPRCDPGPGSEGRSDSLLQCHAGFRGVHTAASASSIPIPPFLLHRSLYHRCIIAAQPDPHLPCGICVYHPDQARPL